MNDQYEMFSGPNQSLPQWVINEIAFLGQAGWKAAAVACKLKLSVSVVNKYYKKFKIRRRPWKRRKPSHSP